MGAKSTKRRPSATTLIACLALFLALGGGVYATAKGSKISGNKIKKSSIAGNRLKKNTVTGSQIKESKLGTVPSAGLADTLEGEKRFNLRLGFGASQALFTAGPFTFTASCLQNATNDEGEPNKDVARITIATSENHTVFDAVDEKRGDEVTGFLETTTPESERVFEEDSIETGKSHYDAENNEDAAAYSDAGTAVGFNVDGNALGENVGGVPGCIFAGTAMVETR